MHHGWPFQFRNWSQPVGSPLKHELRITVAQPARETSPHPHDRVNRHLRRAAFVVGALGFGRFPLHAELVQRLARGAGETVRAIEDRLARQL
jgi:hypothetical protein